ncbi:MAG: hypothetical protein KC553_07450 [Nitrospina sp.]|nr:hypothetical protein [Nitrospina sp.]
MWKLTKPFYFNSWALSIRLLVMLTAFLLPLPSLSLAVPVIQFQSSGSSFQENAGAVSITAVIDQPSAQFVTVNFRITGGTATAGEDHTLAVGDFPILAGQTSSSVNFDIIDDFIFEGDETITIEIYDPFNSVLGSQTTHTVIIQDDEVSFPNKFSFQNSSSSGSEATTSVSIPVTLSPSSGSTTTVNYSFVGGTATPGADFTATNGQLQFLAGETIKNITFTVVNDADVESDETIAISLLSPTGANLILPVQHTYTIQNDDQPPPSIQFSSASSNTLESITSVTIPVELSSTHDQTVTVNYAATGGSATGGGVDYTLTNSTLTFNPGETSKNMSFTVIDDAVPESNETIVITLSNPTNATLGSPASHTYGIDDDDAAPIAQFTSNGGSGPENVTPGTMTLTLDRPSPLPIYVDFRIIGGTATSLVDHASGAGDFFFAPGSTTATMNIHLLDDSEVESNETIIYELYNATNAVLGSQTVYTFTILDDDSTPTFSFPSATGSGSESVTSVTVPVSLFPASANTATIQYSVSSGTASAGSDFTAASGQLQFAAGETSKNITFTVIDDNVFENEESVIITLSSPSGAALGSPSVHTYLIQNNDSASPSLTGPTVVAPYWQTGDGVYSFIAVSHPGLQGMNSQVGVTVSAFLQGGKLLGKSVFTVDEGQTQRVFFIRPNHPAINPLNFPESAYIFTSPSAIGLNTTGGLGFLRMDPVADTPTQPLAGSGGGMPDIRMLAYWGAVVFEGTNTGFALEFIGDLNDSASHPGMAPGRLPSGVN